jgi:hypothetical protein
MDSSHSCCGRTMRSDDGAVTFTLAKTPVGVCVERTQIKWGRGRIVTMSLFSDNKDFLRWCDSDPVRFDYPLVHVNVRRHGQAMLDGDE